MKKVVLKTIGVNRPRIHTYGPLGSELEFLCPIAYSYSKEQMVCGEHCAWFDVAKEKFTNISPEHSFVTCKGEKIAELVEQETP